MGKLFAHTKAPNGTEFKIVSTGMNWTLYVKEKGSLNWKRIQSDVNALFLQQVMFNQKEWGKI